MRPANTGEDIFSCIQWFGPMSAVGGKPDARRKVRKSLLIANNGSQELCMRPQNQARIASEAVLASINWMNNRELDWLQQRPFFACPGGQK